MKHKNKKIIIHPLTAVFYVVTVILSDKNTAICAVICSVIHELGHYFAARMLGSQIKAFVLYPFGAEMKLSALKSYKCDLIISLFGPAINIIAAVIGYFLDIGGFFVAYNITLATLNLLPVKYLDGGSILSSALLRRYEPDLVERTVLAVSFLVLFLLWILSVYIFMMEGGSPSLFFISVTLFASVFLGNKG